MGCIRSALSGIGCCYHWRIIVALTYIINSRRSDFITPSLYQFVFVGILYQPDHSGGFCFPENIFTVRFHCTFT